MRKIKRKEWDIGSFQYGHDSKSSGVDLFKSEVLPFINRVEVISINEHMDYATGTLYVTVYYREHPPL